MVQIRAQGLTSDSATTQQGVAAPPSDLQELPLPTPETAAKLPEVPSPQHVNWHRRPPRAAWVGAYTWRLLVTDLASVCVAVVGSQFLWFGLSNRNVNLPLTGIEVNYSLTSVLLVAGWMLILRIYDTRDSRVVGSGLTEYARTANASLRLFGLVAIIALLLKIDVARGYIITAFPAGVVFIIFSRWLWRQWLRKKRQQDEYLVRVLLVGSLESVQHLVIELARRPYAGYKVVGACLPQASKIERLPGSEILVLGGFSDIVESVRTAGASAVALAGSDGLSARKVRRISWELESTGVELMVAPAITDVAGTRIHTRPVAGLPLIYIESPSYEGGAKVAKAVFDFTVAGIITLLIAPLLLIIVSAIRLTSRGPALFRQERIGLDGKVFRIVKFRTMVKGADARLLEMLEQQGRLDVPLFKLTNDPRITPLGRFLRKYSLDELPQLFNVLKGDMSLVGPRPQRAAEVALYDSDSGRRLLVKPGITGLWQISGRSDLSWEDAVRLDLYYVENWSLTDDIVILVRTAKAVFLSRGAY